MKRNPLVMCLTNVVASNFTANVLLAIGAKPAMVEEPCEAAQLAALADATLVNVGTVHERQAAAMRAAIAALKTNAKPWVLDPVAVQVLVYRRALVREFLASGPTLVRGNRDEIEFLKPTGVTVLATGETDLVIRPDGTATEIAGGVPLLQSVTATGCAQGAVSAALLGAGFSPSAAAERASRLLKRAGELAWAQAGDNPGTFQNKLLDALHAAADNAFCQS